MIPTILSLNQKHLDGDLIFAELLMYDTSSQGLLIFIRYLIGRLPFLGICKTENLITKFMIILSITNHTQKNFLRLETMSN